MEGSTFFLSQNAPTRPRSTRFRSVFAGAYPTGIIVLALLMSLPAQANHRNRSHAATTQPSLKASASTAPQGSETPGADCAPALLLLALIAVLLWRDRKKAAGFRAQILIFEEKVQKSERNAARLEEEKSKLIKEVATVRVFADAKVTELSGAQKELMALEMRLKIVLDANPGAEDRVRAKAKRNAEIRAVEEAERETRRLTQRGGVQVQELLTELKRGW